jgi:hypothetical protein
MGSLRTFGAGPKKDTSELEMINPFPGITRKEVDALSEEDRETFNRYRNWMWSKVLKAWNESEQYFRSYG